jgi:uncharacterized protein YraI
MNALQRPGRAAAVVGAVVAVSATTLMALVAGTASAAEPGRCTDNVNVRSEPVFNAPIVALCEAGTDVEVGETRNGFVRLVDLGGWASEEFVTLDSAASSRRSATSPSSSSAPRSSSDEDAPSSSARSTPSRSAPSSSAEPSQTPDDASPSASRTAPAGDTSSDDESRSGGSGSGSGSGSEESGPTSAVGGLLG